VKGAALAALLVLVLCPAAAAHGGGARGYVSTLERVEPHTRGLEVRVLDGDDRLGLRNETGTDVVVPGYDGEPYLRFTTRAVYRNTRSPATYLNEERYGNVALPEDASSKADPVWRKVADRSYYEWHDHRIHWMSPVAPPQVRAASDERHHVLDWRIRLTVDGRPVDLRGSLDYEPPTEGRFRPILIVPVAVLALAGAALWARRRLRAR
jgi:hypothetical protein